MNTKHAVLSHDGFTWFNNGMLETIPFTPDGTLLQLCQLGMDNRLSHLWIMPACTPALPMLQNDLATPDFSLKVFERNHRDAGAFLWKRGQNGERHHHVTIIYAGASAWHNVLEGVEPGALLWAIRYLENALQVEIGVSPGRVGWNILKRLHPEWIDTLDFDFKAAHFTASAGPDIIWQRLLLPSEEHALYVHKFDKTAAYPYAATSTPIGVGIPFHMDRVEAHHAAQHEQGHPQSIGVWLCDVYVTGDETPNTPPIVRQGKQWLSGPLIRLLLTRGATMDILEGWVFPEKHLLFKHWAELLWAFRESTHEDIWESRAGAILAGKMDKTISNATIGLTAFKGFDDDEMKRADIRLQIIARHRELMHYTIDKVATVHGVTPVIVYMDALYYLSDNPDGRAFLPELVKREGKLGGFRWEGRIALTPALRSLLDNMRKNEASKLAAFNQIGWVQ